MTTTILSGPSNGSTVINNTDSITYTPSANFNGLDTIVYQICDGGPLCDNDTIFITVTAVNDAPVAVVDPATTNEDEAVTIDVQSNDSDIEGDVLTTTILSGPSNGATVINNTDSITYTPSSNFNGLDTIVYQICDGGPLCDNDTIFITVNAVNDAPVAVVDPAATNEDESVVIDVQSNDSDIEGDVLTTTILSGPSNGSTVINNTDSITYTPSSNFNGLDTIVYQICDGGPLCDNDTIFITVTAVNDAPVAVVDPATTNEDESVTIDVQSNDSDIEGDVLTTTILSGPSNGSTVINNTDSITYTSSSNFNGLDTIVYQICDGGPLCDNDTIFITVTAVNDAPVAVVDPLTTNEDEAVTIDVQSNDSDIEGDVLTTTILSGPSNGSTVINNTDSITYTPSSNFNGLDTIVYQICDGGPLCDNDTIFITVTAVNDAPVAVVDPATTNEDEAVVIDVQSNDTDIEGDVLTTTILSGPSNGSTVINNTDSITYTPSSNFNGLDTIVYQICDGGPLCDNDTIFITVTAVNDAPVAVVDPATTNEDEAVTIDVQSNDSDIEGDVLTTTILSGPSNGSTVINNTDSITYTPSSNFNGLDTIIYQICDGGPLCDNDTIFITVTAVNDAPVAVVDPATTNEDESVTIDVQSNDSDIEEDVLTTTILSGPSNGSTVINNTDSITYTPNSNFNGLDTIIYQICDGGPLCDNDTIFITVNAVNDAPVAVVDPSTTNEDAAVTIDVQSNDSDIEGDVLTTTILSGPSNGSTVINNTDSITYTPSSNFNGLDTIVYQICDGGPLCDNDTIFITVTAVNDAPVAIKDSTRTTQNTLVVIDVQNNDTDIENDALITTSIIASPVTGAIATILNSNSISYTPVANFYGLDTFTYSICDGGPLCDTAIIVINVEDITAPTYITEAPELTNQNPFTATVIFNEPVTGFDSADVILGNGTLVGTPVPNATNDTFTLSIIPTVDGYVTINIDSGSVADPSGNGVDSMVHRDSTLYDGTPPPPAELLNNNSVIVTNSITPTVIIEDVEMGATLCVTINGKTYDEPNPGLNNGGIFWTLIYTDIPDTVLPGIYDVILTVKDPAGNATTDTIVGGLTVDTSAPIPTILTTTTDTNDAPVQIVVAFSEPVSGSDRFTSADINVTNGTIDGVVNHLGFDSIFTISITPLSEGLITVEIPPMVAQDYANNYNVVPDQITINYDITKPVVTIEAPEYTNVSPYTAYMQFSEPIVDFQISDILIGNGTVTAAVPNATNDTFTLTVRPASLGYISLNLATGSVTDPAGNGVDSLPTRVNTLYDTTAPVFTIDAPDYTNAPYIAVIKYNEPVTGFTGGDILLENGTLTSGPTANATNDTFTVTITPTIEGYVTINVATDGVQDLSGNGIDSLSDRDSTLYDITVPVATIDAPAYTNNNPFTATISFSEPVMGVNPIDVMVTNGTPGTPVPNATNDTFWVSIVPASEGLITINVDSGSIVDPSGNTVDNVDPSAQTIYDVTDPIFTIDAPDYTNAPYTAYIEYSEPVTGFTSGDVLLNNGNILSGPTANATNDTFTLQIQPIVEGYVTINVKTGGVQDLAGNGVDSLADRDSTLYDITVPVATIDAPAYTDQNPFTVTVSFTEPVTGVDPVDILVINGTPGTPVPNATNDTFWVPISPVSDGLVTINIDSVTDLSGNAVDNIDPSAETIYDAQDPTFTIDAPDYTNAPYTATIEYSEEIVGFITSDILLGNGTVTSGPTPNATNDTFTVIITPTIEGYVTINVATDGVHDLAGNGIDSLVDRDSTLYDITDPTFTIDAPDFTMGPYTARIEYSESVIDFTSGDILLGNGVVTSGPTPNATNDTFEVLITPIVEGYITINVATDGVQDATGNGIDSLADRDSTLYDITPPCANIIAPDYTNENPFEVILAVCEPTTTIDFYVTNGFVSNGPIANSTNDTFTFEITPITEGYVGFEVPVNALTDLNGNKNPLPIVDSTWYDITAPIVTIDAPDYTNAPYNALIQFSEPVTGFTASEVLLNNGTLTGGPIPNATNDTFVVNITPILPGYITINVDSGIVTDLSGNVLDSLDERDSTLYDNVSPSFTIQVPAVTAASPYGGTIAFSEPIIGFDPSDIILINGTLISGPNPNATGDSFHVEIVPITEGYITINLAPASVTDPTGNSIVPLTPSPETYYDSTAPIIPIVTPRATDDVTPTITGNYEQGSDLTVTVRGVSYVLGADPQLISNGTGKWSLNLDGTTPVFDATVYPVEAVSTDSVGNSSTDVTTDELLVYNDSSDYDNDGIVDITEIDAGTDPKDPTDNNLLSEQLQTIVDASDPIPNGGPTVYDLNTALLQRVIPSSMARYEQAFNGIIFPSYDELQDSIDKINQCTDSDGDGIQDATELDAGTDPFDPTDNDEEQERLHTIVTASDEEADGAPTMKDLMLVDLNALIEYYLNEYEAAIADPASVNMVAFADSDIPLKSEIQALIRAVNASHDADMDGINDDVECPATAPCPDTDGDGIRDFLDTDSDGDGILDEEEGVTDCDLDSIPNYLDVDRCPETLLAPGGLSIGSFSDGVNDVFLIKGLDEYQAKEMPVSLTILNRWGSLIYQEADYQNDWAGDPSRAVLGTGTKENLPNGTYYYIIKVPADGTVLTGSFPIITRN